MSQNPPYLLEPSVCDRLFQIGFTRKSHHFPDPIPVLTRIAVDLTGFTRGLRVQETEPPPVRGVLHEVDAVFAQNRVRKIPLTQK